MLLENVDYFVHLVPFPPGRIDGAVMPNDDGTFSIYIDANADDPHRRAALEHELRHIEKDHFYCDKPLEVIEAEADGRTSDESLCKPEHQSSSCTAAADDWLFSWRLAMLWAALSASGQEKRTYEEWREAVSFHRQSDLQCNL